VNKKTLGIKDEKVGKIFGEKNFLEYPLFLHLFI